MTEEDMDFIDMYILAHEFHYTPEEIMSMDKVYAADLISFWQGMNEAQKKERGKSSKDSNKHKRFDEDQIIQNLQDEVKRRDKLKQI